MTHGDRPLRYGAGLGACALLIWIGLAKASPVPLLALVDLGFHELGHLVATPLPDLATALAGSVMQVAVPTGLAAYFLVRQRDLLGVRAGPRPGHDLAGSTPHPDLSPSAPVR